MKIAKLILSFTKFSDGNLVNKAGIEHVMLGSDAPFPIGDPEPLKVFANAKLSAAQKELIFSTTAQKVFRMRADPWTRS